MTEHELNAEEIKFGASVRISRLQYDSEPGYCDHMAKDKLRQYLANHIIKEKVKPGFTDHMVEYRADFYCATPEKFWKIVNIEAERIAHRYSHTLRSYLQR